MPGIGTIHMQTLNLRVARGNQGYWELIVAADKTGPWTIADIELGSNVTTRSVSQLVERLVKGGYARKIAEIAPSAKGRKPAGVFRLTQRPFFVPRLDRDGRELPETVQQVLWRTMKMLKTFTPRELVDAASEGREKPIELDSARFYVGALVGAGIIAIRQKVRSRREAKYALVRSLGARAPQILSTRLVYDPNGKAVVGVATVEAAS